MSDPTVPSDDSKDTAANAARRRPGWRPVRVFLVVLILLLAFILSALATGLVLFTGYALLANTALPPKADAIVVVTGGSGRLEKASRLFREGYGKKLLVSGVHPRTSNRILRQRLKLSEAQIDCCVDFDIKALNTVANATQTASWANKNGFSSLIIVTSAYHMPRTLLEMRRAAPHIAFKAHSVMPASDRPFLARLFDRNNILLLSKEYGKLLASMLHGTSERLGKTR
jgi:uncharacterized SAM-binding protein YcdF (DUF218 family)